MYHVFAVLSNRIIMIFQKMFALTRLASPQSVPEDRRAEKFKTASFELENFCSGKDKKHAFSVIAKDECFTLRRYCPQSETELIVILS